MLSQPRFRIPFLFLLTAIVHTTLMPGLRLLGVMPDVLLLLSICAGLNSGPVRGASLGFGAGLVADLFLTTPMGLSALVFCLVGYSVGTAAEGLVGSAGWFTLLAAAAGSAGGAGLFAVVGATLGEGDLIGGRLLVIMAVVGLLNAPLAPVMARLVRWATTGLPVTTGERRAAGIR